VHNEKLHTLRFSLNRIRTMKSKKVRMAGHVARIGIRPMHRWDDGTLRNIMRWY
jgi:hypothetical protein